MIWRRRRTAVGLTTLALIALRVLLLMVASHGSSLLHPSPYPYCGSAAFEPPESREGLCMYYENSEAVVKNIVDRNSTLHMPEYDARMLAWTMTPTQVSNWRDQPHRYPGGRGMLVSLEVEIANRGARPLLYRPPATVRSIVPSHRPKTPVELVLPISAGGGYDFAVPAIVNPQGAPGPSIFGRPPIEPHSSVTDWFSFVMSSRESKLVGHTQSDLFLSPMDGNPNYIGVIRLWKYRVD